MDNPTFRLEGVVRVRDEVEDFEGPLTLILQLLSKNKIEIQDVQISALLEQYLAYLDDMKAMDLEIASEFVAMASHLIYIKARMLLSAGEETSELEELIQSLEMLRSRDKYESIKCVTGALADMYMRGAGTFVKPPEYLPYNNEYRYSHKKTDILEAILRVFSREEAVAAILAEKPVLVPRRIVYSVTEKTEEVLSRLLKFGEIRISALFSESHSRTELVATFIALLELCKAGKIDLSGDGDEMMASRTA